MDGIAFTLQEGRAIGLTDARLRHPRFTRPFRGVRVIGTSGRIDNGLIDRCADLRIVLPTEALFTHATAARLWGMPLPNELTQDLHVLTPGVIPIRRPGVVGWCRREDFPAKDLSHGLPVTSPADTWAMLATQSADRGGVVSREWLVAIGDFLVSGRRTKKGRDPALSSPEELAAALVRHRSRRGAAKLSWALERVRMPVDSPRESLLRLGLVAARLPEPVVQPPILTSDGTRHPDLGYLRERLLIEYLGDVHRVDPQTWRADLTRVQLFEDAGYRVILAGADDLTPDGLRALAGRARRALRRG